MVRSLLFAFCGIVSLCAVCRADTFQFNHENVLGTSLEIKLHADSKADASAAEEAMLAELDQLNNTLSTYDKNSEMSRWLSSESSQSINANLVELLNAADNFRQKSHGAFDVRVGESVQVWKQASVSGVVPSTDALRQAVSATRSPAWQINRTAGSAIRTGQCTLTFDGIATGLIVDRMCTVAIACKGVRGVMVNLGGDLKATGDFQDSIAIADPRSPTKSLCKIPLRNAALTTSGNYERGFRVGGKWYSHIIDPRTGHPVEHILSATVIAPTTLEADAWATAFCVLDAEQSLDVCQRETGVSCMLVLRDGSTVTSANWPKQIVLTAVRDENKPKTDGERDAKQWNTGAELQVDFEINRAGSGGRYRRPYIAIWVEDADQFPVRTLTLWMQTDEPGPRWHRDLKRWYKNDTMRRLVDDKKLIGTISAATKPPGMYKTVWDGKDDAGKLVAKGKYTLYIEAAREHGTYQLMSKEINIGEEEVKADLGQNEEIKTAKLEYRPKGESK